MVLRRLRTISFSNWISFSLQSPSSIVTFLNISIHYFYRSRHISDSIKFIKLFSESRCVSRPLAFITNLRLLWTFGCRSLFSFGASACLTLSLEGSSFAFSYATSVPFKCMCGLKSRSFDSFPFGVVPSFESRVRSPNEVELCSRRITPFLHWKLSNRSRSQVNQGQSLRQVGSNSPFLKFAPVSEAYKKRHFL